MNVLDLTIIGAIGLVALVGLRSGMLKPASGVGGFILGVILAFNSHSDVARAISGIIGSPLLQKVVAFVGIVIVVVILARLVAWLVQKALSEFLLGWIDHVAGAFGGAVLGVLVTGTIVYMLGGVNIAPAREALDTSVLAPQISQASLLAPSMPWCSALSNGGSANGCTDFKGIAGNVFGLDIDKRLSSMLGGYDAGTLLKLVKESMSGGLPEQLERMSMAQDNSSDLNK